MRSSRAACGPLSASGGWQTTTGHWLTRQMAKPFFPGLSKPPTKARWQNFGFPFRRVLYISSVLIGGRGLPALAGTQLMLAWLGAA
jgi:hypothetical protein